MENKEIKYVFFGSSRFSEFVLDELEKTGFSPLKKITSAREPLPPLDELRALEADVFIVASFGKILPKELLEIPKYGSLNVHPSLLPELRGPAPIQGLILGQGSPGVTIIKMDVEMDHGPIVAQEKASLEPWPDYYAIVEEKLARTGGKMLASILPRWATGEITPTEQDHRHATFIKMVKKEDGLLDLTAPAETNLRKVLAYSTWPGAYIIFKRKTGDDIRVIMKNAKIEDGQFIPTRVIPAGKQEMVWEDFLRGNA
jgi:methionyl-tRNA formyltransferase